MSKKKLNILWISFEDTNPFYGCYGDRNARTPNLDKFASEGCLYTHCFSTAGVCAPARSAIITGMYPISVGTHHMRTTSPTMAAPEEITSKLPLPYSCVLPPYVKCFTEYLRAEGYYCTNNYKTDYQFEPPFTAWDECGPEAHWRNRPEKDMPFFAVFNPLKTHESGMWPENCPEITFDIDKIKVPPIYPDTPEVREALARMYTNIEYNDRILGELLRQLEEDGLAENTVVFHWSDHGPLPRGKRWPYDAGIHVPLIIRWPGHIKPGSKSDRLISTIDLGPTVLSIAEIPIPSYIQGIPFLGKYTKPQRRYVYASRDRHDTAYDMVRAVRDKRFKYIRNYCVDIPYNIWIPYMHKHPIMQEIWRMYLEGKLEGPQKILFEKRPPEELYDTFNDPYEINNLAENPEYKKVLERMRKALDRWISEVGDMGKINESDMVRFWYPDGKQPETEKVVVIPIWKENYGIEPIIKDGVYKVKSPVLIQLYCPTQGASIGYTFEEVENPKWLLYKEPIPLPEGKAVLRAKAIRIGYKESEEIKVTFIVE